MNRTVVGLTLPVLLSLFIPSVSHYTDVGQDHRRPMRNIEVDSQHDKDGGGIPGILARADIDSVSVQLPLPVSRSN